MTGTVIASMLGLPGNGRRISFRLMHVFEFRDGLVSHENVWLDTGSDDPRTGMPGAEPEFGRREDPSRRGRFVPSPRRITATSTHTGHELCRALHCARVNGTKCSERSWVHHSPRAESDETFARCISRLTMPEWKPAGMPFRRT